MKIEDEKLKELNSLKVELMKKLDKKEITEEKYKESMTMISQMSMEIINNFIKEDKKKEETKTVKGELPMVEAKVEVKTPVEAKPEVKVKKEKAVKVKKEKKVSRQDLILRAMLMKSINSVDKVVAKVLEWNPGDKGKEKDVKVHVNWTVGKLKKKAGRFAKYTFDAENFTLTQKE